METICRTILVYCLHHYKGDENIKSFIWDLITPTADGQTRALVNHSGRSAACCLYSRVRGPPGARPGPQISPARMWGCPGPALQWGLSGASVNSSSSSILSVAVLMTTGLSAPVPRGRKGKKVKAQSTHPVVQDADWLAGCNPDALFQEDSYRKHLKHHCNKYAGG